MLMGCSRPAPTAYAVPLALAPSRAGAFCLERFGCSWKARPGIAAQNGTRFPDRLSGGNCDPEYGSSVGCIFRLKPQAESASRNSVSERVVLSGLSSSGNCVPESCLRMGRAFRWPVVWKVHPSLSVYSGMRFPLKDSTGKPVPPRGTIPGHAFH